MKHEFKSEVAARIINGGAPIGKPTKVVDGVKLWHLPKHENHVAGLVEGADVGACSKLAAELAREFVVLNPPPYNKWKNFSVCLLTITDTGKKAAYTNFDYDESV